MTPTIRVFNTLTLRKEELVPQTPGRLGVYVCGPTVYSYIHIGNARTFTSFDLVVRYLRYRGFEVRYVRNFTDIDDKIIRAAQEAGEPANVLANRFIEAFREDAKALHLIEPDVSPRVSENVPEIIELIRKLVEREVAYVSDGDVYFSVSHYPSYAKLSKRNLDDLRAGERVAPDDRKREPLDFALWKSAKPGEPSWESPWGPGRPGWHIECSAMSEKYLGESFDVHGGGLDLIFPHHENELAQSEAASGKPFVRYWMHGGFLDLEGAKMSKSLGNVVRLRDALARVDPEALRFFFLSTHYRNPLSFSDKSLADAETRMEYFYETLRKVDEKLAGKEPGEGPVEGEPERYVREMEAALDDDFNFPGALSAVSELFTALNELTDRPKPADKQKVLRTLKALRAQVARISSATGLLESDSGEWLAARRQRLIRARGIDEAWVESRLTERAEARKARDFARSDAIRDELAAKGIEIRDTPAGTVWKPTSSI